MSDAIVYVHGVPAKSWEQISSYANGDAHAQSKIQVFVNGRFYDVKLEREK